MVHVAAGLDLRAGQTLALDDLAVEVLVRKLGTKLKVARALRPICKITRVTSRNSLLNRVEVVD